jgi:hypothetical protein
VVRGRLTDEETDQRLRPKAFPTVNLAIAMLGAAIFALAGGVIGSMNAGWFGLGRNANAWLPFSGIGAGLLVFAFRSSVLYAGLSKMGSVGLASKYLLVAGPVLYVLSWAIEFAILGTLALGVGLICLTAAVWRGRIVSVADRTLITLSAAGSLTWNTETVSAFLLVAVGVTWAVLSARLLSGGDQAPGSPSA